MHRLLLPSVESQKLNLNAEWSTRYFRASLVEVAEVSVVIPVRNRPQLVGEALKSVLKLDECHQEIIVIDDGSTDTTLKELLAFDDPRIAIVSLHERVGANSARNIGIAIARSQVIAFLDSDDAYFPGRISKPFRVLCTQPDVGIVISSFIARRKQKESRVCLPDKKYPAFDFHRLVARYVLPPTTSGLTARRSALIDVGGFDAIVNRMQDRDLVLRLSQIWAGATISEELWLKRWQPDSITANSSTFCSDLIAFLRRHPIYSGEEKATREYLVTRHLIRSVLRGRLIRAVRDHAAIARAFKYGASTTIWLVPTYLKVRQSRRAQKRVLAIPTKTVR